MESAVLSENCYKHNAYFGTVQIVQFHYDNDCIILCGLRLENDIYYYLNNCIWKTSDDSVMLDEIFAYRDPETYIDGNIKNALDSYVGRSLDLETNIYNFPFKALKVFGREYKYDKRVIEEFDGNFADLDYLSRNLNIYKNDFSDFNSVSLKEEAIQITEYDLLTENKQIENKLNEMSLSPKENSIIRMINESTNELEILICENSILKITDDDKNSLFNKLLQNRKIQLKI